MNVKAVIKPLWGVKILMGEHESFVHMEMYPEFMSRNKKKNQNWKKINEIDRKILVIDGDETAISYKLINHDVNLNERLIIG